MDDFNHCFAIVMQGMGKGALYVAVAYIPVHIILAALTAWLEKRTKKSE